MTKKKGVMDSVKGYFSGEFNEAKKKGAVGYVKDNPLKAATAVVLLPLDLAVGGFVSFAITAPVVVAAVGKTAVDLANGDTASKKKKNNKFTERLNGGNGRR